MRTLKILIYKNWLEFSKNKSLLVFMTLLIIGTSLFLSLYVAVSESIIFLIILPFSLLGQFTSDSFAGEKENKTMETLLASPLNINTIFLSKVLFSLLMCSLFELLYFVIQFLVYWNKLQVIDTNFYNGYNFFVLLIVQPLILFLCSYLGVYFSFRSNDQRLVNLKTTFIVSINGVILYLIVYLFTLQLYLASYVILGVAVIIFTLEYICCRYRLKKIFYQEYLLTNH